MGQGGSSNVKVTAQDRSILDLKLQRDKLKQYQKRLESVSAQEQEIARVAMAAGNKSRALAALRRRKYQESLLSKTDGQLETLQQLVSTIEFSLVEKDVLFGLKQGNAVLKEIHSEMNVENVEKLMSDTADGIAYQKEVEELMASRITNDEEEEVQAELEALIAAQLPATPLPSLPNAPEGELPTKVENKPVPVRQEAAASEERVPMLA